MYRRYKLARIMANMSRYWAAMRAQMSEDLLLHIEQGRTMPTEGERNRLAELYMVQPEWLDQQYFPCTFIKPLED